MDFGEIEEQGLTFAPPAGYALRLSFQLDGIDYGSAYPNRYSSPNQIQGGTGPRVRVTKRQTVARLGAGDRNLEVLTGIIDFNSALLCRVRWIAELTAAG